MVRLVAGADPAVKYFVKPILLRLHQIPILKDVLAPLIGRSMDATVFVNIDSFAGAARRRSHSPPR